jgi:CheY-like chemotaxis protein
LLDPAPSILIVDDEDTIRTSLSLVLQEFGFDVRSAENGFAAPSEIGKPIPEILLSDLNMPGMSGYELLSIVQRRFPAIRLIAMSGAFRGSAVPSGAAADAFYEKGSGVDSLLKIIGGLTGPKRPPANQPAYSAPLWIQRSESDAEGRPYVSITCPDCQQTFHEPVGGSLSLIREARCVHCSGSIYYAIVEPVDWSPAQIARRAPEEARRISQPQFNYL